MCGACRALALCYVVVQRRRLAGVRALTCWFSVWRPTLWRAGQACFFLLLFCLLPYMLVQLVVAHVLACWSACLCLLLFCLLPFVLVQHVVAHVLACLSACLFTLLCLLRRAGRAYARGCLHMYCDVPLVWDRRAFGVRVHSALPRRVLSTLKLAGIACFVLQVWRAGSACLAIVYSVLAC